MERVKSIINDTEANVRIYLLKKQGRKADYEAVLFPNAIDNKIKETYAENFIHFCGEREITEGNL